MFFVITLRAKAFIFAYYISYNIFYGKINELLLKTYLKPCQTFIMKFTAWKLSIFGVFLVRISRHSDWIRRDTPNLSVFSPNAGKCGLKKKSEYGHFSRSDCFRKKITIFPKNKKSKKKCSIEKVLNRFLTASEVLFRTQSNI